MTQLDIAITDDWEIRGDGSGDMRVIQFETGRRFAQIFSDQGLSVSFNVEVMQQLRHREFGARFAELAELADEWESTVHDFYRQGHDIQLHVHTQWSDVEYEADRWYLKGDWSMLRYSAPQAHRMIAESKAYLERLMLKVDPNYRCVAYRAGGWCLAPSPYLIGILIDLGIELDISITRGLHYNQLVELDYRHLDEATQPFYPMFDDARRMADSPGPLVCCPVAHFEQGRFHRFFEVISQRLPMLRGSAGISEFVMPSAVPIPGASANNYGGWGFSGSAGGQRPNLLKRLARQFEPRTITADISAMNMFQIRAMLRGLQQFGSYQGLAKFPVVLAHHTKDMGDTYVAESLASLICKDDRLNTVTLQQLASHIAAGRYGVRYAGD